jgi:hypothetical protein
MQNCGITLKDLGDKSGGEQKPRGQEFRKGFIGTIYILDDSTVSKYDRLR